MFSDKSRFLLDVRDMRIVACLRRSERIAEACIQLRHIEYQRSRMVWDGTSFESRASLMLTHQKRNEAPELGKYFTISKTPFYMRILYQRDNSSSDGARVL